MLSTHLRLQQFGIFAKSPSETKGWGASPALLIKH